MCGSVLEDVWGTIGGFPGHEHVHPSSVVGYQCSKCNRYFPLGEFLLLKEKEARKKARARNYWKAVRTVFQEPLLYIIVIGLILLGHGFWVGIAAGVAIAFLLPLLASGFRMLFSLLGKIGGFIWKKLSSITP